VAGHGGPVLLVAPDVPGLSEHHAAAALDDLADGLDIAFAPATDGRPFLIALATLDRELLATADSSFEELAATIRARDGGLGLLRSERRLVTPADARALAADPLAPPELLAFLGPAMPARG
jgi:hypothetical protein